MFDCDGGVAGGHCSKQGYAVAQWNIVSDKSAGTGCVHVLLDRKQVLPCSVVDLCDDF